VAAGAAPDDPMAAFGANEWLVDEMYEQYQRDPDSVDKAWWAFFKDYTPGEQPSSGNPNGGCSPGV
jgi:multifunctional 2-oxoglutarate metabolism enzyme